MKRAWLAAALLLLPATARADDHSQENDVLVHLEGPSASSLLRLHGSEWIVECVAPCDLRVRPSDHYRVGGRGIQESDPFMLAAPAGSDETIRVHGGSEAQAWTGAIIFISGFLGSAAGLIMTQIAAGKNDCDDAHPAFENPGPCHSYDGLRYAGIVIGVGGLVNIAFGAVIYAFTGNANVIQTSGVAKLSPIDILPVRSIASHAEKAMPASIAAPASPLFSFSF